MARTLSKNEKLKRFAWQMKGLTSATRIRILGELYKEDGKLSPTQLNDRIPNTTLPSIAYHVRELKSFGWIRSAGTRPARGAVEHFHVLTPEGKRLYEEHARSLVEE